MGTKNNPGRFDCYAKLDPNEPYFTLRSTDGLAPPLVDLWAALATGDHAGLDRAFTELRRMLTPFGSLTRDQAIRAVDKATEARTLAAQMRGYAALQVHHELHSSRVNQADPDNGCSE